MQRLTRITFALLVIGVAAFGPATAQANIIVNGDFENLTGAVMVPGSGGSNTTYRIYSSILGWTAIGSGLEIQFDPTAGLANSPNKKVELDSWDPDNGGPLSSNSAMFQDAATTTGQQYTLSFFYSPRPNVGSASNGIDVYWGGLLLDSITGVGGSNTSWTQYSYTVFGGAGLATELKFAATGTAETLGGYIDDVSAEPVPEPGTLLLLGSGITGLVMRRRRRS